MTNSLCDDVVCRAREDREDIACQRSAGHDGEHIHTRALGWCCRPHLAGPGHGVESRITMHVGHMREDYE